MRGRLFRDADSEFYCPDNGRDSVPPSLLATAPAPVQQGQRRRGEARADFDLRWKVALGIEAEDRPFAKSTLQVFRAQLILHGKVREVFESSLRLARESGCLKGRGMRVALDTTNILGRRGPPTIYWPTGSPGAGGGGSGHYRDTWAPAWGEAHRWADRPARTALQDCGRRGPACGVVAAGAGRVRRTGAPADCGGGGTAPGRRAEGGVGLKDGVSRDDVGA